MHYMQIMDITTKAFLALHFSDFRLLRKGLAGGVESGDSSLEEAVKPTWNRPPKRYQVFVCGSFSLS
jgi:hypothetical protein